MLLAARCALLLALPALLGPGDAPAHAVWELVWSDEFSRPAGTPPDPQFWTPEVGNRDTGGWGNRELQFYTRSVQNARQDGEGHLLIRALRNAAPLPCWNGPRCAYTSARLTTRGKASFVYGKVEARLRVPPGRGLWPAFWSMGRDVDAWPANGEIDIMEWVGHTPNTVHATLHGPGYTGPRALGTEKTLDVNVADDFHVYTLVKRRTEILWLLDGQVYHRVTPEDRPTGTRWVFDQPFHLLLNLAVGGEWPGPPSEGTVFPAELKVDYVRVWREAPPR